MTEIFGQVDARFRGVREAFARNFENLGELGAAVAVTVDGRAVVDLWGGVADKRSGRQWTRDTLTMVFSCTKGATALCAHVLCARGELDLDAPVARYWPEFAAADKETLPVRMLLNHQAGLPAVSEPLPPEALFDWPAMTTALATQRPHWPPGTAHGYHAMTFGWLIGELVRRVSGTSLGAFFQDAVARRLGLEFWIGLPADQEPRVSTLRMPPPQFEPTPLMVAMLNRDSLTAQAFLNPRGLMTPGQVNSRAVRAAELPAANGVTTARGLAGMYTPLACGGRHHGVELVDRDTIARMRRAESEGDDRILLLPTRFASGFMKSVDNRPRDSVRFGPNPEAFGHVGAGGSVGMADPVARVAIGYVMNQMGPGVMLNARGQALIDAVYDCLGR
jgi:CubicO group peptidase (beta-lactamase class C family)